VSSGGLGVALAEMAVTAGIGCFVNVTGPAEVFCELPSRFVVSTNMPDELHQQATALGIPVEMVGRVSGDRFGLGDVVDLPLGALSEAYEGNLALLLGDS
jgi:phosphoribosylformylglycinamidine (FGAM) synthase-like enzyme